MSERITQAERLFLSIIECQNLEGGEIIELLNYFGFTKKDNPIISLVQPKTALDSIRQAMNPSGLTWCNPCEREFYTPRALCSHITSDYNNENWRFKKAHKEARKKEIWREM